MKKLSFLELEKKMERLSMEEASRTKGGGDLGDEDRDCAFQSMSFIMRGLYRETGITEQGMEDDYNDFRNSDPCYAGDDRDWANENGLQSINETDKGLLWINTFLMEHYTGASESFSASYIEGNSILPNTTGTASNDQYMVIVGDQTDSHAVTFLRRGKSGVHKGDYLCMDSQRDGHQYWYSPDDVIGVVDFHKTISTTLPTTGFPTTTGF